MISQDFPICSSNCRVGPCFGCRELPGPSHLLLAFILYYLDDDLACDLFVCGDWEVTYFTPNLLVFIFAQLAKCPMVSAGRYRFKRQYAFLPTLKSSSLSIVAGLTESCLVV